MRNLLEKIAAVADEIKELAQCDIDCFGDDFCSMDYVKMAYEIKRLAEEFENRKSHRAQ